MVFEYHTRLHWRAPVIDGQVCRLWRQIILDTSRAWAYLEICNNKRPSISNLLLWLSRSRKAFLHIRADKNFIFDWSTDGRSLYSLLCDYHARIATLRMGLGEFSFFERRDFPCMQLLEVHRWFHRNSILGPVRWGSTPKLQSLRLGPTTAFVVPLDDLPPLKTLSLYSIKYISLSRHHASLVALMLHTIHLESAISSSIDFPSLTHLALFGVRGLKPHINAPCLVTYHESGYTVQESFSAPILSLAEYGVYGTDPNPHSAATRWHRSFPNILKLSIRAGPPVLISILHSLAGHPHLLPALRMLSVGSSWTWGAKIAKGDQKTMEGLIQERSEACLRATALRFEPGQRLHLLPSPTGVSHCPIRWFVIF